VDPQPSRFERLTHVIPDRRVVCSRSTGQTWAAIETNARFNFLPLFSPQLRELLLESFPARSLPSPALLRQALRFLQDHARVEEVSPALRVNSGSRPVPHIALDAAEGRRFSPRTIEIRPGEWSFTKESWAPFYRPVHNARLPDPSQIPAHERSLEPLRQLLNLASPQDFTRILVWLLAALRPEGPYPILVLQGPSGSGKSQAARMLRSLIDPSAMPFLPLPGSETRLWQLAFDHYILAFDHLSAMPRRLSDMLARLSSGASCFWHDTPCHLQRPILLTVPGDATWTPSPDLASRILVAHFSELPRDQRLPESEMEAKFQAAHAPALAALCDAVSQALTRDPHASGAMDAWARAAAPALHLTDAEISAALANASQFSREPDPLIAPLRDLLLAAPGHEWTGSSTQLLAALPESVRPSCPEELSKRLKKIVESLEAEGVELTFIRTNQQRSIRLRLPGLETPPPPSTENSPSPCHPVAPDPPHEPPPPPPIENPPSPCHPVTPDPAPAENSPSPCHVAHRPSGPLPCRPRQQAVFRTVRPRQPLRPTPKNRQTPRMASHHECRIAQHLGDFALNPARPPPLTVEIFPILAPLKRFRISRPFGHVIAYLLTT
jgi:hypothetical protein